MEMDFHGNVDQVHPGPKNSNIIASRLFKYIREEKLIEPFNIK